MTKSHSRNHGAHMDSPPSALLLALLLLLLLPKAKNRRLPPGPAPLPVLGNLLWLTHSDDVDTMRARGRLHAHYGPLLSLRVGSRLLVTVADRHLAHVALVERGAALADRPDFANRDFLGLNASTITSSNYGPLWRLFRRNFVAEVAHPARLRQFSPLRASVLAELTDKLWRHQELGGDGVGTIKDTFQYAMFCLLVAMCFGERIDEGAVRDIAATLSDLMLYSMFKLDVFAFLPAVTTRLFRGRLRTVHAMRCRLKDMYMPLIDARRVRKRMADSLSPQKETTLPHSYVDTLLDMRLNHDGGRALADDEIAALCSEILVQGTDTTVTSLEWIMAELVKNPSIQGKLYEEIETITCSEQGRQVSEEDVQKMPYLRAVVLEGLRRHPPGHILVPHAAAQDMELGGYFIPKGTQVNFLVAIMGMDERTWEKATEFVPERFLAGGDGEEVDITCTRETKMMPFGAGRRICPGMAVATLNLQYFVANLVRKFEWQEMEGEEVDVCGEKAEFTVVMKKPLRARLVMRGVV